MRSSPLIGEQRTSFHANLTSSRHFAGEIAAFVFVHQPRRMLALCRQSLVAIILGLTVVVTTSALEN